MPTMDPHDDAGLAGPVGSLGHTRSKRYSIAQRSGVGERLGHAPVGATGGLSASAKGGWALPTSLHCVVGGAHPPVAQASSLHSRSWCVMDAPYPGGSLSNQGVPIVMHPNHPGLVATILGVLLAGCPLVWGQVGPATQNTSPTELALPPVPLSPSVYPPALPTRTPTLSGLTNEHGC